MARHGMPCPMWMPWHVMPQSAHRVLLLLLLDGRHEPVAFACAERSLQTASVRASMRTCSPEMINYPKHHAFTCHVLWARLVVPLPIERRVC